jgi:hypothetical protein
MKLESPLSNLLSRCETLCVAGCCGRDAYDFSPIHIASFLSMWSVTPDPKVVAALREQIATLRTNYGSGGASGSEVVIDEMNQCFTAEEIDTLTGEIAANLAVALDLMAESEKGRFKNETRA